MPAFIPRPSDDGPCFDSRGPAPALALKTWTREILRLDADAVSVVGAMVASHRISRRVPRERDRGRCWLVARRLQPAQVEEAAMGVAQRVVTRTRDADLAPAAPAGAVGPQRNAVAPI